MPKSLDLEISEHYAPLFDVDHPDYNSRYQVYYGGRGGGKSWQIARGLILRAFLNKSLILCTREIQNSINDSVLRLLSNQIELMGLSYFFEIQKTTIRARNGSEFIFKGLNGLTIDSIKSLEGVDFCWVEEAHSVSEHSWSILIPTIRKETNGIQAQIIASFNPDMADDPVFTRFVLNSPPSTYICKINYTDNEHCPQTIIDESNYLKRVDYEAYAHIYLGEVRSHSDAQIFKGKYRVESFEIDSTYGNPLQGADWGFSTDPTVLMRVYIKDNNLYIRNELYKIGCEVTDTPAMFDRLSDARKYQIRADNARPEIISHMAKQGFKITSAEKWPGCVEDRISFLRSFEQIIVHPDCEHTAEEMRLYSYKTDKRTGDVLPDIIDKHNHCIDAIGYALTPLIKKKPEFFVL